MTLSHIRCTSSHPTRQPIRTGTGTTHTCPPYRSQYPPQCSAGCTLSQVAPGLCAEVKVSERLARCSSIPLKLRQYRHLQARARRFESQEALSPTPLLHKPAQPPALQGKKPHAPPPEPSKAKAPPRQASPTQRHQHAVPSRQAHARNMSYANMPSMFSTTLPPSDKNISSSDEPG